MRPPGAWKVFGNSTSDHTLYADHLQSERPELTTQRGRSSNLWKVVAHRDNHLWDCTVGCAVAASIAGCDLNGMRIQKPRKPRPTRQADGELVR